MVIQIITKMKKYSFLYIFSLLFISIKIGAQNIEIIKKDFKEAYVTANILDVFHHRAGGICGASTIFLCDTLLFQNQIILLDQSPIIDWYVFVNNNDQMKIDQRFSATWEIEDNQLCLSSIHFIDEDINYKKDIEKQLKNRLIKGLKVPLSSNISGGSDCLKTPQGYAAKNRYLIKLNKGQVYAIETIEVPYGTLEQDNDFSLFVKEEMPHVFSKEVIDFISERTGILSTNIILISDQEGAVSLYLNTSGSITIGSLTKGKTLEDKGLITNLFLASKIPSGSFYGRFLKDGVLYPFNPYRIIEKTNGDIIVENYFIEKSYLEFYSETEAAKIDMIEVDKHKGNLPKVIIEDIE